MSANESRKPTADVLYPAPPPNAGAAEQTRDRDVADILFGSETLVSSYGPVLADAADRLSDRTGMSQQERDAHIAEMATTFDDARILPEPASRLHALVVQHIGKPVDDATVDQWATEARRQLRDRYGLEESQRRIEIAKQFIANRPTLAKLLEDTKLGSHPDIVVALTENPERLRLTPRPKK
jgi:hypothetical protein